MAGEHPDRPHADRTRQHPARGLRGAVMTGVAATLAKARGENRAALVGYLPVGFPDVQGSIEAMVAMVESGVDIVEIGVPYSDPLMDGPVIQHAAEAALQRGSRLSDVFTAVRAVADAGAPALVMTYWNPVMRYGVDRFAGDLAAAGGAGLITPDLIPDEARDVDRRRRAQRPRPGLPRRAQLDRRAAGQHRRGLPRLRLRRLDDGRHRGPRPASATPPAPWWPGPAR